MHCGSEWGTGYPEMVPGSRGFPPEDPVRWLGELANHPAQIPLVGLAILQEQGGGEVRGWRRNIPVNMYDLYE
ncbi:MAG: hypothetical protein ACOYEF_00025 [Planifilum sp.]|jgi:hypothetical protein